MHNSRNLIRSCISWTRYVSKSQEKLGKKTEEDESSWNLMSHRHGVTIDICKWWWWYSRALVNASGDGTGRCPSGGLSYNPLVVWFRAQPPDGDTVSSKENCVSLRANSIKKMNHYSHWKSASAKVLRKRIYIITERKRKRTKMAADERSMLRRKEDTLEQYNWQRNTYKSQTKNEESRKEREKSFAMFNPRESLQIKRSYKCVVYRSINSGTGQMCSC